MNKQDIYDFLKERGYWHEITEHPAVYNMAEVAELEMPYPESDAKNLFVRDDKRRNYYLITVMAHKTVNLKEFKKNYGTRSLTFASPDDLMDIMGLIPGAVTPLGVLNDSEYKVKVYLDKDFLNAPKRIGVHPNDNTATVWLNTEDLAEIIQSHGTELEWAEL